LIDEYAAKEVIATLDKDEQPEVKFYDLKNKVDPRRVSVSYEGDLLFKAS